ncbi:hypothetical protein NIES4071_20340 [Calothrix sp. NIES-4071]|nr:hypothetical protein NIES4071_20340 [Calothrix sp. NIES-4071]BAZ56366.1 hypothetical protein NIES4105_20290 [Calothrix sp. NIES-4105]
MLISQMAKIGTTGLHKQVVLHIYFSNFQNWYYWFTQTSSTSYLFLKLPKLVLLVYTNK